MLEKVIGFLNKILLPTSRFLNSVGVVVTVAMMVVIVVGVFMRYVFNSPIRGERDLTIIGFSIIVFLPMALCAFRKGHVSIDALTNKLSKGARSGLEVVILLITTATMSLLTWQLFVLAYRYLTSMQTTKVLSIPMYPFVYLAALGILMMTLVYFVDLLVSISSLGRRK